MVCVAESETACALLFPTTFLLYSFGTLKPKMDVNCVFTYVRVSNSADAFALYMPGSLLLILGLFFDKVL